MSQDCPSYLSHVKGKQDLDVSQCTAVVYVCTREVPSAREIKADDRARWRRDVNQDWRWSKTCYGAVLSPLFSFYFFARPQLFSYIHSDHKLEARCSLLPTPFTPRLCGICEKLEHFDPLTRKLRIIPWNFEQCTCLFRGIYLEKAFIEKKTSSCHKVHQKQNYVDFQLI